MDVSLLIIAIGRGQGDEFKATAKRFIAELEAAGLPQERIQVVEIARKGSVSVSGAASKIEQTGREVSAAVYIGHGVTAQVAADRNDPKYANTRIGEFAHEPHVQKAEPPMSTGPEAGKSLGDIVVGAERRVNPPTPSTPKGRTEKGN